jgi:ABC-2 type transport system ATP-binding protein
MSVAIQLENVSKSFSTIQAVDDLCLTVPTGSIYGILGPNGAGKSTTLRMVMNILAPDAGRIELLGSDLAHDRTVLRRVGYLPEERGLYKRMRVKDVIVFFAELKGMDRREAGREALVWLERMELAEWANRKVQTLSKGMQQKVQFIATVIYRPEVLILDEPFSGLDPVNQEVLRDTIVSAHAEGRTVVLSTHNMAQAEAMCEHVCIIAHGRKVLDGPVSEIRRRHRGNVLALVFDAPSPAIERHLRSSPLVRAPKGNGARWEVELADGADPRRVLADLSNLDVPLSRFEHVEPSLHEIFVEEVGRAARTTRNEVAHA